MALPAAGLGLILSRFVCLGVLKLLEVVLDGATSLDLYYSNTALAMHRSATEYLAAPGWGALAVIALGTLALALLSCLVFSVVSLERRHKKRRRESRAAQGTPSRPLRGGPPDLCAAVGAAGRLPLPGAGAGRRVRGRPVLPAVGYRYPL